MEKTLVLIVGPTAVGKTALAIDLAARYNTEIISADSRQVFREMTIGTAKPTPEELKKIRHHFIDSHSISDDYDAARYGEEALKCIHQLFERHDVVVMCGGSGLYIKAALEGFDDIPPVPEETREYLLEQHRLHGLEWLQQELLRLDPAQASLVDMQNPARIMRALEVRLATGISISSFHTRQKRSHNFRIRKIGLNCQREELYRRIDERMDKMIAAGLFDEAESLVSFKNKNALQTVGYREIFGYLDGAYDRTEAIRLLKRNSRRYAKRQLTWFCKDEGIRWFESEDIDEIIDYIEQDRV